MNIKSKKEQGFSHIELLVVLAIVGVVGFTGWRVVSNNSTESQASNNTQDESSLIATIPTDLTGVKSIPEIQALAEKSSDNSSIVGVELKDRDGLLVYKLYLSGGNVLVMNANTGELVETLSDGSDSEAVDKLPEGFVAGITLQQAIDTAKNSRPNSTVEKVEFEQNGDYVVYRVQFTDESRVDVNATDGTIHRLKDETGTDIIKVDEQYEDAEDKEDSKEETEESDEHDEEDNNNESDNEEDNENNEN